MNAPTKPYGGKMYWRRSDGQVRVALKSGRVIDLGIQPLEKARSVSEQFGMVFVMTGPHWGNPLRNVSQGGGSFPGSTVGTAQPKKTN